MNYINYEPTIEVLTYEELEVIVQAHRDGDTQATERLIGAFWAFIQKYVRVISQGKADIADRNIRQFSRLFMPKEEGSTVFQFRRSEKAKNSFNKAIENIHYLFRNNSYNEVLNEAILAFLTMAERYNSKGNFFHLYVEKAFHFQYYRQLKSLLELNPSNNRISYYDEYYTGDEGEYSSNIIDDTRFWVDEPLEEVNENWINGLTTGEYFDDLTPTQRRILKLNYVDGNTDEEISHIMGVCRATINRRKKSAERMIEVHLQDMHVLKDSGLNETNEV